MHLTGRDERGVGGCIRVLKEPAGQGRPAERDPPVVATMSEMLARIERTGMPAVLDHPRGSTPARSSATARGSAST